MTSYFSYYELFLLWFWIIIKFIFLQCNEPDIIGAVTRITRRPHPADFEAPKDYTTRVDLWQQRRLCDCVKCVQHGLRLNADRYSAEIPVARGIRYVTLPGIQARPSTRSNRDRLARLLQDHAETTLVVCSCASCTAHRNLLWAWTQARRHTSAEVVPSPPPPPPVVGFATSSRLRQQPTAARTMDHCSDCCIV